MKQEKKPKLLRIDKLYSSRPMVTLSVNMRCCYHYSNSRKMIKKLMNSVKKNALFVWKTSSMDKMYVKYRLVDIFFMINAL